VSETWEAVGCTVRTKITAEDREGIEVARVALWHGGETANARAHLIAVAPEMLEELRALVAGIERIDIFGTISTRSARELIARAEGRS
jgi:hypothetical protein